MPTFSNLAAQAAAVRARGPQRPGTTARPRPVAPAKASQPLPGFMRGGGSRPEGAPGFPASNAAAEAVRAKMPQTLTSEIRGAGFQPSWGPVVGPRPGAFVMALQGMDGVDGWLDSVLKVAQSVIPKGTIVGNLIGSTKEKGTATPSIPAIVAQVNQPTAQPQQVAAQPFYQQMMPQDNTQKIMLGVAGLLGVGLLVMVLRRR